MELSYCYKNEYQNDVVSICLCVDGFGGENCEHDIDECASNPCQNGAICHDYVNSYTCECKSGFSGTNCHTNDQKAVFYLLYLVGL